MIRVVVFDCDGVLLESVDAKTRAFGQVVGEYGPDAVAMLLDHHLANGGISRVEKFKFFIREFLEREPFQDEVETMCERFAAYSLDNVLTCSEVPGARSCLESLHGLMPLFVASGAPQDELRMVLQEHNFSGYFDAIYGSPRKKPDILRHVQAQTKTKFSEILMVGDSSTDLEAALAVGARFYGRGEFAEPHIWADDLNDLARFVQEQVATE